MNSSGNPDWRGALNLKRHPPGLLALMTLYEIGLPSTRKQVVLKPLPRAIQRPAHRQGCCHPIQCRPVGLGLQSFVLITVQLVINIIRCWGELKSLRPQSVGDRGHEFIAY